MNTTRPDTIVVICDECSRTHVGTYSHNDQHNGNPLYAVTCDDGLTDYYTAERDENAPYTNNTEGK